jgi:hypothetical protein
MASKVVDYKKVLTSWAKENGIEINAASLLSKSKGKEHKLFLRLAKQYDKPNPLNGVFKAQVQNINTEDYRKVAELYLSIFYPSEAGELDALMLRYKGDEKNLIAKLQANFNACDVVDPNSIVDYAEILTKFLNDADKDRVSEVESTLAKCQGRETILFAVLSKEYKLPNPLNGVFLSRVDSIDTTDYVALARLYLSIFNPRIAYRTEALVRQYRGNESELFAKLASKFHAVNPLAHVVSNQVCNSPTKTDRSSIQAQSPGIAA